MKKLIIFDCDGVLVDSEILASTITAKSLTKLGFSISGEELAKMLIGTDAKTAAKLLAEKTGKENLANIAKEEILLAYEKELKPLIYKVVEKVYNLNILCCIVSNNLHEKVIKAITCTNQHHFFKEHEIFTAALVQNGKPAPDLFFHAMNYFKVKPEECLVIEDSTSGIKGALAAGIEVIGFLGGGHAQYGWYREKITALNVPTVDNDIELYNLILKKVSHFNAAI